MNSLQKLQIIVDNNMNNLDLEQQNQWKYEYRERYICV